MSSDSRQGGGGYWWCTKMTSARPEQRPSDASLQGFPTHPPGSQCTTAATKATSQRPEQPPSSRLQARRTRSNHCTAILLAAAEPRQYHTPSSSASQDSRCPCQKTILDLSRSSPRPELSSLGPSPIFYKIFVLV